MSIAVPQYTDEELLGGLTAALEAGFVTANAYDAFARLHSMPSHHSLGKRFGTWNQAKLRAGASEISVQRGNMAGSGPNSPKQGCSPHAPCTAHFWTVELDGAIVYKDYRYPDLFTLRKFGFPHNEALGIVRVDYVAV